MLNNENIDLARTELYALGRRVTDKQALYRIIDGMLTKNKFKDFFTKNIAAL